LPLFVGPDAGNGNLLDTISISATNPFNPFGVTLDASNYSFIGRRYVENGPRRYNQSVDTYYGSATLDGRFRLGSHDWFWDVNGLWGRNDAKQTVFGNVNAANVARALGPVAACTAPCVPLNIPPSPPASAPTFRRSLRRAASTSTKSMASCGRPCSPTSPSSSASSCRWRHAIPIIRPRARR
jgi:iron complex outermembrane receptor protein